MKDRFQSLLPYLGLAFLLLDTVALGQTYFISRTFNSGSCEANKLWKFDSVPATTCIMGAQPSTSFRYDCPSRLVSQWNNSICDGAPVFSITGSDSCTNIGSGSQLISCENTENPVGTTDLLATGVTYKDQEACQATTGTQFKTFFYGGCRTQTGFTSSVQCYTDGRFVRQSCTAGTCASCSVQSTSTVGVCSTGVGGGREIITCLSSVPPPAPTASPVVSSSPGAPIGSTSPAAPSPTASAPADALGTFYVIGSSFNPGASCSSSPAKVQVASNKCVQTSGSTSSSFTCPSSSSFALRTYATSNCAGAYNVSTTSLSCNSTLGFSTSCSYSVPTLSAPYVQQDNYGSLSDCSMSSTNRLSTGYTMPLCLYSSDFGTSNLTFCNSSGIYETSCQGENCTSNCTTRALTASSCSFALGSYSRLSCVLPPPPVQPRPPVADAPPAAAPAAARAPGASTASALTGLNFTGQCAFALLAAFAVVAAYGI